MARTTTPLSLKRSSKRSNSKGASLKSGRPPLSSISKSKPSTNPSSLSSKHTRTLINTHHLLQKRLATARSQGSTQKIQELEAQLASQGGLQSYQLASRTGQSKSRGGDSSRVLVHWLNEEIRARKDLLRSNGEKTKQAEVKPMRILEVGALSTQNALNIPGITTVRRIDLRSSEDGIEEIDFMALPLPHGQSENPDGELVGYDVLSLSLVLNYVPDPKARGDMLRRTTSFFPLHRHSPPLSPQSPHDIPERADHDAAGKTQTLPCLFLVLPGPCLDNSRYLTAAHLTLILNSFGYSHLHTKTTRKLYYSLWRYDGTEATRAWVQGCGPKTFNKTEINPGGGRNNFCIVLE